jgi:hypothetical protein
MDPGILKIKRWSILSKFLFQFPKEFLCVENLGMSIDFLLIHPIARFFLQIKLFLNDYH